MKTFLVGMPGSGKSYWGQQVAARYSMPYIDLDSAITAVENMSIPQIFEAYEEEGFRERERKCLLDIIESVDGDAIIACGGGTPCFYDNMQLMKDAGTVIYLEATPDYLQQNMEKDSGVRPLLDGSTAQLAEMLTSRGPYFRQAHLILQAKDISLATFEKIIGHV